MAVTNTISNKTDITNLAFNDPFAIDDTNDLDIFGAPITKKVTALQVAQYIYRAFAVFGTASTKTNCAVATDTALTVTYANGTLGVGATLTNAGAQAALVIDGRTMLVGDRVLVWKQAAFAQNGIYTVTAVGDVSTNWVMTRATDYDESAEITLGTNVSINGGATLIGGMFVMYTTDTVTVGTTPILFKFLSAALISGTSAFTLSGSGTLIPSISGNTYPTFASGTYTVLGSGQNISVGTIASDSITFSTGSGIKTGTTAANTALIAAYDVDGAAYSTFGLLTANNTPTLAFSQPSGGTLTWDGGVIGGSTPAAATFTTITSNSHTFNTGTGLKTGSSAGNTYLLTAFDVDNAISRTFLTFTAANTPSCAISQPTGGTLTIDGGTIGGTTPPTITANTLAVNSTSSLQDDVTIANGKALKGDTTTGHTWLQQGYDNTSSVYRTFVTITNGNTTTYALSAPTHGSITIDGAVIGGTTKAAGSFTTLTSTGLVTQGIGTGAATVIPSGALSINTTGVNNVSTGETTLMTYDLPANTLVTTGQMVEHEIRGVFTSSVNAKTLKIYFGGTVVLSNSLPVSTAGSWWGKFSYQRTGSSAQNWNFIFIRTISGATAGIPLVTSGTCTETETAAITMKVTGTGGASDEIGQKFSSINNYAG